MYNVRAIKDVCYDPEHGLLLDLYLPEREGACPLFVFFHGGGFEDYRQKDMGEPLSRELAARGIACVNPAYRHYPGARFPDFIEDGALAVAWAKAHMGAYCEWDKLFVGGHSAGAHLAMLLCFDGKYLGKHGLHRKDDVTGYAFASGQPTTHMNVLREAGVDARAVVVDARAPLFHVRESGSPLLVLCTDDDIENRLQQTELFVSTLKHFGYESEVEYKVLQGYGHNNYLYPDEARPERPSAGSGIIANFIERRR